MERFFWSAIRILCSYCFQHFYWQDGYGIFSINPTETDKVIEYIKKQHDHHKHKNFQDEYRAFLKKYNVEYDERDVWD